MTADDQQAMDESLAQLRGLDRHDLMEVSGVVGRLLLAEPDLWSERAQALAHLQIVPTMFTFAGVTDAAIAWHIGRVLDELRRVRPVLERLSTELTMHSGTLVRVSTAQSGALLMLARVLYVLAHEDRRG